MYQGNEFSQTDRYHCRDASIMMVESRGHCILCYLVFTVDCSMEKSRSEAQDVLLASFFNIIIILCAVTTAVIYSCISIIFCQYISI